MRVDPPPSRGQGLKHDDRIEASIHMLPSTYAQT